MLLPALARAKQAANTAKCKWNMKQLGPGYPIFTWATAGYLPAGALDGADNSQYTWDTAIHQYVGGNGSLSQAVLMSGAVHQTLVSQILRCPSDMGPDSYWTTTDPTVGRRTYAMNYISNNWGDGGLTMGAAALPKPSDGLGVY